MNNVLTIVTAISASIVTVASVLAIVTTSTVI